MDSITQLRQAHDLLLAHIELQQQEIARLSAERDKLAWFLEWEGYRRCDIEACNCGNWHQHQESPRERAEAAEAKVAELEREVANMVDTYRATATGLQQKLSTAEREVARLKEKEEKVR